jgi:hypothetical protein
MSWANRDLQQLERRIGEAYQRVVRCRRLIEKLRDDGHTAQLPAAEELLVSLQKSLDELRSHQQIILGGLAREADVEARWRWR